MTLIEGSDVHVSTIFPRPQPSVLERQDKKETEKGDQMIRIELLPSSHDIRILCNIITTKVQVRVLYKTKQNVCTVERKQ